MLMLCRDGLLRGVHAILAGLLLLLSLGVQAQDELNVALVLSDRNIFYQNFATTLQQNLPAQIKVQIIDAAQSQSVTADILVSVGVKAAEQVAATPLPWLAVMIPSSQWAGLASKHPRAQPASAIYLDQPWARQVDFLRAVLPGRRKIGVLYAPDTSVNISSLDKALSAHGLTLVDQSASYHGTLFEDLQAVLTRSEVLLTVPDSGIYNSNTIRNILLESYRQRVPLVGYSQALVNAGALCAIFSTPEQLAAQTSVLLLGYARSARLPEAQYPSLFRIAVNDGVARALGIPIKSPEMLRLQLEKLQGGEK